MLVAFLRRRIYTATTLYTLSVVKSTLMECFS